MRLLKKLNGLWAGLGATAAATGAWAQSNPEGLEIIGAPVDRVWGFQPAATGLAEQIHFLDNMILVIITVISLFVMALLAWVIIRHNARSNPTPATFSHNTPIEVTWTVVPLGILVFIGAFSLPVLFNQQEIPEGDVVIKVTGHQWYWTYEYPEHDIEFDSFMLGGANDIDAQAAGATPGVLDDVMEEYLEGRGWSRDEFLLATDTIVVVPTGQVVVMQVTADDVIHSWTIPAFGVKQDGVPGRLAELWFEVEPGMEGIYFGQCSELCGQAHSYMPITVAAVEPAVYEAWLASGGTDIAMVLDGEVRELELALAE